MKRLKHKIDKIKPNFEKGGKYHSFYSLYEGLSSFLFTPNDTRTSGVHIHDSIDSKRAMIIVVIALLPCMFMGMYNIGYQHCLAIGEICEFTLPAIAGAFYYGLLRVLPQIIVAYVVGLGIEFTAAQMRGHEIQEGFLVSGVLIPMICPVDTPLWMLAVAVAFAVIFAKEVFGGTGYNIFNVALVARAFLFFAYPAKMSGDKVFISLGNSAPVDGFSGATPLGQLSSWSGQGTPQIMDSLGNPLSLWDCFVGLVPGSWGETSTLCVMIGGALLLLTGIASWRIMLSGFLGALGMSCIVNIWGSVQYPATLLSPAWQFCLGGLAFALVFMATDPVTACRTKTGKWIYGFLTGVIIILIRCFNAGYPEGAMLAVLLMNAFASLIDWCVVRANINRRLNRLKKSRA